MKPFARFFYSAVNCCGLGMVIIILKKARFYFKRIDADSRQLALYPLCETLLNFPKLLCLTSITARVTVEIVPTTQAPPADF